MMYRLFIKRGADIFLSFFLLLFCLPLSVIISIFLSIWNKGTPFFFHKRPGKNGRIFTLVKFKTMNDNKDADGKLLLSHQRITRAGRFIRSFSLDEIPQLWNVLKGDMSLVGPRPLLITYLPLYNEYQLRRHDVRPGITGWAQVNGRNAISWEQKFDYDVWYVDNYSFWIDSKILFLTLIKVFFRDDINQNEKVTMEPFRGSKSN